MKRKATLNSRHFDFEHESAFPFLTGEVLLTPFAYLRDKFGLSAGLFILVLFFAAALSSTAMGGSDVEETAESGETAVEESDANMMSGDESSSVAASDSNAMSDGDSDTAMGTVAAASLDSRFVKVIYRDEIEASGIVSLYDFLIERSYFNFMGMRRSTVSSPVYLINGHEIPGPYSSNLLGQRIPLHIPNHSLGHQIPTPFLPNVLETLPVAAVEKIEFYSTGAASLFAGGASGGAINIVLREKTPHAEAWTSFQSTAETGGETEVVGGSWGGKVGDGHLNLGAEWFQRNEIQSKDRDYSRPQWIPGEENDNYVGVSASGNHIAFLGSMELPDGPNGEKRRAPLFYSAWRKLGDCDPAQGYAGEITNHPDFTGSICGYIYGDHYWETESVQRESLFMNYEQPLGESTDVYFDGRFAQGDSEYQLAPDFGGLIFPFLPLPFETDIPDSLKAFRDRLLQLYPDVAPILTAEVQLPPGITAGSQAALEFEALAKTVGIFHRFVAHGNLKWFRDTNEHDLEFGLRGELTSATDYDISARFFDFDSEARGENFVIDELAIREIRAGQYDVENPYSTDPAHLAAVERMRTTLTKLSSIEHQTVRAEFNGAANSHSRGQVDWTTGVEYSQYDHQERLSIREPAGLAFPFRTDLVGLNRERYEGDRSRISGFADFKLPLSPNWVLTPATRVDRYSDVGTTYSWQLASAIQLNDSTQIRSSYETSHRPPSMRDLHMERLLSFQPICPPTLTGEPCNVLNIATIETGNPDLKPDKSKSLSIGATADLGDVLLSMDIYRIKRENVPMVPDVQQLVELPPTALLPSGSEIIYQANVINGIQRQIMNAGEVRHSGIDLGLQTQWETDSVNTTLGMNWHYTNDYDITVAGYAQPTHYPNHQVHVNLSSSWDNLTATWNMYGLSGTSHNFGEIGGWTGHDILLNVKGGEGAEFNAGVLNVTNRGPSVDPTNLSVADRHFDAVRGRTLVVSAKLKW